MLEEFVCEMYGYKHLKNVDEVRYAIFEKSYSNEVNFKLSVKAVDASTIPLCQRELHQQLPRASYVTNVWKNAHSKSLTKLSPIGSGWKQVDDKFEFKWFEGEKLPSLVNEIIVSSTCNENNKVTSGVSWEEWWTYDGISGPAFWGLINPEWSLCNKGRRQSPVNLEPNKLLFDPNLRLLHLDKHRVNGVITNTGHSIVFTVENTTRHHINVTGGPLSYKYQFHQIHIHYGLQDETGSEHSINGYTFPAEIQIFGFNSQLYSNFSEALHRAQGIVAISLLMQLGDLSNPELRILTDQLDKIRYGGEEVEVKRLSIMGLLPDTEYYMTYDGSTTMPACHETVTWVILNKPIYITKQQLHALRRLMQGDGKHPKAPLGNNYRPPQPLHHRPLRTNIDFNVKQTGAKYCPSMYKEVYYKANSWKPH